MAAFVQSVQTGRVAPLGAKGVTSAIVKRPVDGPRRVTAIGIEGDEQADPRFHGGRDKALYGYAAAHYAPWTAEHPAHAARFMPGAFGENLTIDGLTEDDICVGDVHAIGDVRLQITEPREPCFKFALKFEDGRMPRAMIANGRSGWYYRVLGEGTIAAGDALALAERPHPDLPFRLLIDLLFHKRGDPAQLARLAAIPLLGARVRGLAKRRA